MRNVIALLAFPGLAIAASLPSSTPAMEPAGNARSIAAWTKFCESYVIECAVDTAQATRIKLDEKLWNVIVAVNRKVNASIKRVTDQEHWSVPDRWNLAEDGKGDNEDYALVKRKLLAEAGLPRRAMRMTVVLNEKGEGHAVLTLITDRGDFILDSETNDINAWYRTGHVFIKRESQETQGWVSLGGVVAPATSINR